jgi:hypothetical protein
MDRHQLNTVKETSGELHHDWESDKVATMMAQMQEVGRFENSTLTLRLRRRTRSSSRLDDFPDELITTGYYSETEVPIESTADPALHRHETPSTYP